MFLNLLLASTLTSCPIEDGRYQLRGNPTVTARFHDVGRTTDWPTGLALEVHAGGSGRSYWFLPWQGGTDGRTNLAWVREKRSPIQFQPPRRDLEFFTTDAGYAIADAVPTSHEIAPPHMLLPDLGNLAWHSTVDVRRDSIARAFFDLADCDEAPSIQPQPDIEFPAVP